MSLWSTSRLPFATYRKHGEGIVGYMKPRIGVTTSPMTHENRSLETLERAYVAAVVEAGGVPFMLPVLDPTDATTVIEPLDGLLVTGGGDVDPARYGNPASAELQGVDIRRDAWELTLVRAAWAAGLPVLGICRGAQVINVAMGGTLVQHLPDTTALPHRVKDQPGSLVHLVRVQAHSRLSAAVARDVLGVNSLHHQAVAEVGTGLVAVAWADDGVIEAVEGVGPHRVLGVQWHPELLPGEPGHAALFEWLVQEARARPEPAFATVAA